MNHFNYFLLSKYTLNNLKEYPLIKKLIYNVVVHYKYKNKLFLLINLITLLLFGNNYIKSRFYFKTTAINVLQVTLRNENKIYFFVYNFIYNYFPLIDSFSLEFKYILKKQIIVLAFFKYPLFFELNILFTTLEHLIITLNSYKFELQFLFKKQKNILKNYNLLQYLKLPLISK